MQPTNWDFDENAIREQHPGAIFLDQLIGDTTYRFAFSRPGKQHVSLATGSRKVGKSMYNLVTSCAIVPDRTALDQFLDYFPASALSLGGSLLEAVGLVDVDRRP